jgi:hypothetical protein
MITVPMSAAMYQAVVANLTGGNGGEQVTRSFGSSINDVTKMENFHK